MAGHLLLSGGGEFQKGYEQAGLFALQQAGGNQASVVILTTGPNGPALAEAGKNWFRSLGATTVETLFLEDPGETARPESVSRLAGANLVYLADGDPADWLETLQNGPAVNPIWATIRGNFANGKMLAAAGGGGMVLMEHFFDASSNIIRPGLGLFPNTLFVPQFNGPGRKWVPQIQKALPQALLIGIDEKVAIGGKNNDWQVFGRGWVTVYRQGKPYKYQGGQPFKMIP